MISALCPLCASSVSTWVRSINVESLLAEWQHRFQIDVTTEMRGVSQIDLLECVWCHLQFFVPDQIVGSPQLYTQLEKFDWYYMPRKWEHDMALNDLQGCQTLLEIGCGFGDFVMRARKTGIQAEGIDLNESAVRTAQQRGLPVQQIDLREAAARYLSRYDVVCGFQVLEHMPNPKEFFEWSCALIKPGGKLLIGVPNADSYLKLLFDVLDMPPHHLTRWSSQAVRSLPRLFPLRLEYIRQEPLAKYHVAQYVGAQYSAAAEKSLLQQIGFRLFAPWLRMSLEHNNLRQHITGHTLYASFERVQ